MAYIRTHYQSDATDICISPQIIVVHWTGSYSLKSALHTFEPDTISPDRSLLREASELNVSAHFLVDRDGTIYQLVPVNWMARHTIGLNRVPVGIENVGGPKALLSDSQLEANAWLIRYLVERFPQIRFLIGHFEYQQFRGTPLWEEVNPRYLTNKEDPGYQFMSRLRQNISDLRLSNRYTK